MIFSLKLQTTPILSCCDVINFEKGKDNLIFPISFEEFSSTLPFSYPEMYDVTTGQYWLCHIYITVKLNLIVKFLLIEDIAFCMWNKDNVHWSEARQIKQTDKHWQIKSNNTFKTSRVQNNYNVWIYPKIHLKYYSYCLNDR